MMTNNITPEYAFYKNEIHHPQENARPCQLDCIRVYIHFHFHLDICLLLITRHILIFVYCELALFAAKYLSIVRLPWR